MFIMIAITIIPTTYGLWKSGAIGLINRVLGPIFWIGLVLFIAFIFAAIFKAKKYLLKKISAREIPGGLPATATVISCAQGNMKLRMGVQEVYQLTIDVNVTNTQGETWPANLKEFIPITQVGVFQPGVTFSVVYDPNDRSKIALPQPGNANATPGQNQGQPLPTSIEVPGGATITSQMAAEAARNQPQNIVAKMKAHAALLNALQSNGITSTATVLSYTTLLENYVDGVDAVEISLRVEITAVETIVMILTPKSSLHKIQPGKTIYVRYDPNNPNRVAISGLDRPVSVMAVQ